MSTIFHLTIPFLIYFSYNGIMHNMAAKIRCCALWCINGGYKENVLTDFIFQVQSALKIPPEYCLGQADLPFMKIILSSFAEKLKSDLLSGMYEKDAVYEGAKHNIRRMFWLSETKCTDFFILKLESYLCKHQYNAHFGEYKLYNLQEKIERASWGSKSYDVVYSLTNYGLTYHKLFHICNIFCVTNKHLNKFDEHIPGGREEYIDKKQITFWNI